MPVKGGTVESLAVETMRASRLSKTEIGERLRSLRRARGLTQLQVARGLGLTEGAYRSYEAGRTEPRMGDVPLLARILGVSPAVLFGGTSSEVPGVAEHGPTWLGEPAPSALPAAVREAMERLSPHDRETAERALGLLDHVLAKAGVA